MREIPDSLLYDGVRIDIAFGADRPSFGDIFLICGERHPRFPPTTRADFARLADLQFTQVDDYFGVPSLAEGGNDVVVWLFPLVNGAPVHHHAGPFDAVRLEYSILRNPARFSAHFLKCIRELAPFGVSVLYRNRETELGVPPDLSTVESDIDAVVQHWAAEGIVVGSDDAMEVDF